MWRGELRKLDIWAVAHLWQYHRWKGSTLLPKQELWAFWITGWIVHTSFLETKVAFYHFGEQITILILWYWQEYTTRYITPSQLVWHLTGLLLTAVDLRCRFWDMNALSYTYLCYLQSWCCEDTHGGYVARLSGTSYGHSTCGRHPNKSQHSFPSNQG